MVLRLPDTGGRMLRFLTDGQTVLPTKRIRNSSDMCQIFLFKVELLSVLEADGVDYQMRMDVCGIGMCGNDDLVILPLLRQLQSDCVRFFRRNILLRMEGLDEMKVHFAIAFAVLQLGADELRAAGFDLTVDAGD